MERVFHGEQRWGDGVPGGGGGWWGERVYCQAELAGGVGVPGDGFRDVPDVSFSAADHDGYLGCFAAGGGSCVSTSSGTEITVFSGTSAAAPGMAGIAALLNTRLGAAQGNLNPTIYKLAASTPGAFHDVTVATSGVTGCSASTPSMCNNSTPGKSSLTGGLAGFVVGAGYDQATGLGSLDVANFLAAASGGSTGGGGTAGSFTLSASPTTLSVTPVANTTTTSDVGADGDVGGRVCGHGGADVRGDAGDGAAADVCDVAGELEPGGGRAGTATVSLTSAGPTTSCLTNSAQERDGRAERRGGGGAGWVVAAGAAGAAADDAGCGASGAAGVGLGLMSGCGGSASSAGCSNAATAGTTAGTYTVTVTGTSGSLTATAPVR